MRVSILLLVGCGGGYGLAPVGELSEDDTAISGTSETDETTETTTTFDDPTDDPTGPIDEDGDGVPAARDCDDDNRNIYPGAEEIPGDGVDQNCDGEDPDPAPREVHVNGSTGSISDWTTSTFSASVNGCASAQTVTVNVNLTHTYLADVIVTLNGPGGVSEPLYNGNLEWDSTSTRVNDTWRVLGATVGNGTWNLRIEDDALLDSGSLTAWSLDLLCD